MTSFEITTGTDLVSVPRIDRLARARGARFLGKWFTPVEIRYCLSKAFPARHLAARLAAKEAVLKALPTSWHGPLPWHLVEVTNDGEGRPAVRLLGPLEEFAAATGLESLAVSLSHTDEYATATVVAVSASGEVSPASDRPRDHAAGEHRGQVRA